jgi:Transcriptional regulatory protein, C terminal
MKMLPAVKKEHDTPPLEARPCSTSFTTMFWIWHAVSCAAPQDLSPLSPRHTRCLVYLVQHRDRVVTREELLEQVMLPSVPGFPRDAFLRAAARAATARWGLQPSPGCWEAPRAFSGVVFLMGQR